MFKCKKCGGKTRVIDNVYIPDDNHFDRKRKCVECNNIFYTKEFEVNADSRFKYEWRANNRDVFRVRGDKKNDKRTI